MPRIYVSSTYEDLKDYREAANGMLRKLQQQVICMEDYVATDRRSLDKCLQDVAESDLSAYSPGVTVSCRRRTRRSPSPSWNSARRPGAAGRS